MKNLLKIFLFAILFVGCRSSFVVKESYDNEAKQTIYTFEGNDNLFHYTYTLTSGLTVCGCEEDNKKMYYLLKDLFVSKTFSWTGFVEDRHYRLWCLNFACELGKSIKDSTALMKYLREER